MSELVKSGDLADIPTERLEQQVCELAAHLAAATCRWLLMIAELDRRRVWADWQMTSCAHWLSWRCGLGLVTARDHVRVAHALTELPLIRAEFATGRLSYSKVRAITRIATPALERELVHLALGSTAAQAERLVRGYRRAVAGEEVDRLRRAGRTPGPDATWYVDADGYLMLTARLAPDDGMVLLTALNAALHHEPLDGSPHAPSDRRSDATDGGSGTATPRAPRTTRAEALAMVAQRALAATPADHSGADRHLVNVHVDHEVLLEPDPTLTEPAPTTRADDSAESRRPARDASSDGSPASTVQHGQAHYQHGPAMTAEMARRLLCDTTFRLWADDLSTGRPLGYGRTRRTVTAVQRRLLLQRDHGRCAVPGCSNTRFLHAHHVVHWLYGGRTDPDNLVMLCTHHHGQVHDGHLRIGAGGGGRFTFHTGDGRIIAPVPTPPAGRPAPLDRLPSSLHIAPPVTQDSLGGGWNGDRLHLDHAVWGLLQTNDRDSTHDADERSSDPDADDDASQGSAA